MTTLSERRIIAAFKDPYEEILKRDLMARAAVPTPRSINNIIAQGYMQERATCSGAAVSFTAAGRPLHRLILAEPGLK